MIVLRADERAAMVVDRRRREDFPFRGEAPGDRPVRRDAVERRARREHDRAVVVDRARRVGLAVDLERPGDLALRIDREDLLRVACSIHISARVDARRRVAPPAERHAKAHLAVLPRERDQVAAERGHVERRFVGRRDRLRLDRAEAFGLPLHGETARAARGLARATPSIAVLHANRRGGRAPRLDRGGDRRHSRVHLRRRLRARLGVQARARAHPEDDRERHQRREDRDRRRAQVQSKLHRAAPRRVSVGPGGDARAALRGRRSRARPRPAVAARATR